MNGPIDVYARESRKRDKDQTTTTAQIAVCRSILDERGLAIGEIWEDKGKSAWNPKVYRDNWEALMTRLESGEASGVIVYDLERFARQVADGERLVKAAERGLVVLDSEGSYDLRKPGDKKNFRNAIVAAEYYSDLLRVRVRRGKAAKARSGQVDQGKLFGFEPDGTTPCEEEARVIRDHARRLLAGETQASLIAELNQRPGKKWGYTAYRATMCRARNAGLVVYRGQIVATLPEPHILDRATYDRLVALFASRKPGRQNSGRYVLTGIALCGECGGPLSGRTTWPRGKTGPSGSQYFCRHCYHTYVAANHLDDWAGEFAIAALSDTAQAEALEREDRERAAERERLTGELAANDQLMTGLAARLGRGELGAAEWEAFRAPLVARQADIQEELAGLEAQAPEPLPPGLRRLPAWDFAWADWLARWDMGTNGERRAMVLRALRGRRMVIGPGRPGVPFDSGRVSIHPVHE